MDAFAAVATLAATKLKCSFCGTEEHQLVMAPDLTWHCIDLIDCFGRQEG